MSHITRLLKTFDYHNAHAFALSLVPSCKYGAINTLLVLSAVSVSVDKIFGLDAAVFVALLIAFMAEVVTGIWASVGVRKEKISSIKISRFTVKTCCYLIVIALTHLMATSYFDHHKYIPGWAFDWMNVFITAHITYENIVSILENLAVIDGKDKSAWIDKIQEKFNDLLK
jgi:hypothetical protein